MARQLTFRLINCKKVQANSLMVFDLAVGYTQDTTFTGILEVRGCWLKQKRDGSGNYVSFPSKLRVRNGEVQKDDNGYDIYDNIVDLYMEQGANPQKPDGRAPTEAAWNFRRWLIEEATKTYTQLAADEGTGPARQAAKSAKSTKQTPKPAAAQTATHDDFDYEDEDDGGFPF
jgi:hypothetical protein